MRAYEFFTQLVESVRSNSALQVWATGLTGRALKVYKGKPVAQPDLTDDAPYLVITEPTRTISQTRADIRYLITANMYLAISGDNGFNPAGDIELAGYKHSEEGAQKLYEAMASALSDIDSQIMIDDFSELHDINAVSNEVVATMGVEFLKRLSIGESQF